MDWFHERMRYAAVYYVRKMEKWPVNYLGQSPFP